MNLASLLQVAGVVAIALPVAVSSAIAIFTLIPGAQPEKFLTESVLPKVIAFRDLIAGMSRK